MEDNHEIIRMDTIQIEYQGTEYLKIGNQWWEAMGESLEQVYNMEDELNDFLEELEELE